MTSLIAALDARFTDFSELEDITNYGMSAGFGGFIYSTELAEFFEEHESEIEDILDSLDIQLNDLVKDPTEWTFQEVKEASVWMVVEDYAFHRVDNAVQSALEALPAGVS